ncbi:sensor histidine kinase [Kitasatospora sp. NBC_00315]|uniref:sensor histidine kinase n=1 Tax=Kitasatospora sp. NBC_00315 TaxID=2975963 RepID=UPI00352FD37D
MTNLRMVDRLREQARRAMSPTGRLPRPTLRNLAFDTILALAMGLFSVSAALGHVEVARSECQVLHPCSTTTSGLLSPPLVALVTSAALLLRRRYPLAVLWVVMGATVLGMHDAPRGAFYAGVIAAYSAAAHSPYRVPVVASLPAVALLVSLFRGSDSYSVPDKYVPFLVLIPIVVAAHTIRTWTDRSDQERARVEALQRERVEALRRAVEQERARIARELHDIVTHNVSMMVIQAGAARKVLEVAPDQAREALLAVEAGGRTAMTELRHVMGLLTMDQEEDVEHSSTAGPGDVDLVPQPGLSRLEALIAGVRATGVPVELTVGGQPQQVPSGVELAVYRVVQEGLTNMVKHAAGASAVVALDYTADRLRVDVIDTGGRPAVAVSVGSGRGLIGLRERIAVYGGTLQAGRRPAGGYRVRALIPLEAS